jgi:hypothetical protein
MYQLTNSNTRAVSVTFELKPAIKMQGHGDHNGGTADTT